MMNMEEHPPVVTTDPAINTLGQEELIEFMSRLMNSGMSNAKVAEYGYEYALELSVNWQGVPIPRFWQLRYASIKLENAAAEIGIYIK